LIAGVLTDNPLRAHIHLNEKSARLPVSVFSMINAASGTSLFSLTSCVSTKSVVSRAGTARAFPHPVFDKDVYHCQMRPAGNCNFRDIKQSVIRSL
jgi:hypothetical protein